MNKLNSIIFSQIKWYLFLKKITILHKLAIVWFPFLVQNHPNPNQKDSQKQVLLQGNGDLQNKDAPFKPN